MGAPSITAPTDQAKTNVVGPDAASGFAPSVSSAVLSGEA